MLHLAYAWLPVGLGLPGAAAWSARVPASLAIHALTAGAATTAICLAVTFAALARLAAAMMPDHMLPLLAISSAGWIAAFGGIRGQIRKLLDTSKAVGGKPGKIVMNSRT